MNRVRFVERDGRLEVRCCLLQQVAASIVAVAMAYVAMSLLFGWGEDPEGGAFALVWFGACSVLAARSAMVAFRPAVLADEHGITFHRFGPKATIAWSDVEGFQMDREVGRWTVLPTLRVERRSTYRHLMVGTNLVYGPGAQVAALREVGRRLSDAGESRVGPLPWPEEVWFRGKRVQRP